MKYSLILFFMVVTGCTTFTYTSPDGRSASFMSFKNYESLDVEIKKDGDKVVASVHTKGVTTDVVKGVTNGVLKGMGIVSGASLVKGIGDGIIKGKIAAGARK